MRTRLEKLSANRAMVDVDRVFPTRHKNGPVVKSDFSFLHIRLRYSES